MVTIELLEKEDGSAYLQKRSSNTIGRRYDNLSNAITVVKPERESDHTCKMLVLNNGQVVDVITVTDTPITIGTNLSQYEAVTIGFMFTGEDGYVKNSEPLMYFFMNAIKPVDFVPETSQATMEILSMYNSAFTDVEIVGNMLNFSRLNGQRKSVTLPVAESGGTSGNGGSNVDLSNYVTKDDLNVKLEDYYNIENAENRLLTAHKEIILDGDGVFEDGVYNFHITHPETYLAYRTNGMKFRMFLKYPAVGNIDYSKRFVITFGDTVYYNYGTLSGAKHLILQDIKKYQEYDNTFGYRFIFDDTFIQNSDNVGFMLDQEFAPVLSLTSEEMDAYVMDGGLPQWQLAICSKVINNGYDEGRIYRFKITYPDTYEWEELSRSVLADEPNTFGDLHLSGTSTLASEETFNKHVQIFVEFETDGVHAGFDAILHPYDSAICFSTYSALISGQKVDGQAYLDMNGHVVINVPVGATFTNIKAHYKVVE